MQMQPGFPGQLCPGSGSGQAMGYPKSEHFFGAHKPSGHSTYRSLHPHFAEQRKSLRTLIKKAINSKYVAKTIVKHKHLAK